MQTVMDTVMKILYKRSGSTTGSAGGDYRRSTSAGSDGDSSGVLSGTTINMSNSSTITNGSCNRLINTGDTVEIINSAAPILGEVKVQIYNDTIDDSSVSFSCYDTCEDICLSLAKRLGITPTMLNCFGLGILDVTLKKHYWIAPKQKPSDICYNMMQTQEYKVFFRMRFFPEQSKCRQLDEVDPRCLEYLTWQVKWDFLHSISSCNWEESKTDEARGFSCMLILLALRLHSERENCTENLKNYMKKRDLDNFLPVPLRKKLVEGKVLKNNMLKKVEELQKTHPVEHCDSYYIMKWCLQVAMKQNKSYKTETFVAYDLDIDNEEFESIDGDEPPSQIAEKQELVITIRIDKSKPTLTVMEMNERRMHTIDCYVENVSKLEICPIDLDGVTWWRVHIFRQDGHPEMLYFDDSKEAYSFATCVECYNRLTVDYYDTVCTELVPSLFNELNTLRAHGPVRDEFVKKKLLKKNSKDLYILRLNLKYYDQYDVLYLPSITINTKLKKVTLPKIVRVEDGYTVDGSGRQPQDIKFLMNDLVREANLFPSTCLRIKPQSEGCDLLHSFILGKEPVDVHDEDEEKREKRKIENQPKVYNRNDLKLQSMLGQGHFTEVYRGLLLEQHHVIIKKMRVKDIEDGDFRLVQEAFSEGIDKLVALADYQYFVAYMGMSMTPDVCMILKGTSHGSLQQFLQSRDPTLPMLSLHHLLDANIQVASALVYMEEKNCYHGNLHCGNISVMNYDNRTMVVRICDPGLVSLYNRLPLQHPVNMKRLPWLAPELHSDLSSVTAQSEVYAYGTTLWQMFSMGLSPIEHDPKLKRKTPDQIVKFFADGDILTRPEFLTIKTGDPEEIKEVKRLLLDVMVSCWNSDIQERADPKRLLKEINSNAQTYEDTYHKYNVIPEYDIDTSSYGVETRPHSSGFNTNHQNVVLVPDISCLKQGGNNNLMSPPNRNENRTQTANQAVITTALLRPVHNQHSPVQVPQAAGATNVVTVGAVAPRVGMSPTTRIGSYSIEKGKLEIDWNTVLGRGHYGAVYKGKLHPKDELLALDPQADSETVVVKVLRHEMADTFGEDLKKEAIVMQKLHHPNVVKFYDICHGGRYLVMEYVENNSLFSYISKERKNHQISEQTFLQLATDIAAGMEYLESQRVIHCDLAARNVLLTRDIRAKISDFGLSKILTQDKDYYRRTTDKTIPILWCAPEWVGHKRYLHKSDVWSYGVTVWEMYSYGKTPYASKKVPWAQIIDLLTKGERLEKPRHCPEYVYTLLRRCWELEPNNRPDFQQLRTRFQEFLSASVISSRPKQVAVRRHTTPSNQAKHGSNQNNAPGAPGTDDTTKTNTLPSVCVPVQPEQNQQSTNKTGGHSRTRPVENGHETQIQNAARQSSEETNVKSIIDERTNETKIVTKDINDDQTERKEVLAGITDQVQNLVKSENQLSSRENENLLPKQGQSLVNGTGHSLVNGIGQSSVNGIANHSNQSPLCSVASNQSGSVSRQLSTGSGHSISKENKKSSETILIDKCDLHYSIRDILGKGAYGQVFKATYRNETVALKQCTNDEEYSRFRREFELLFTLKQNSSNIVKFIGLYKEYDSSKHMYVMEYLEGGSLHNYLIHHKQSGNVVDAKRKILFLIDIAKGMNCLFQKSIVHGDLTAKNVLLTKDLTAKICDLGWAKKLENEEENVEYRRNDPTFQPLWTAPEVFERCVYTKFSDTWSYGVVCVETFQDCSPPAYNVPFDQLKQKKDTYLRNLYGAILKGLRMPKPAQCPQTIYNEVIVKCWQKEYKDRMHYREIIEILSRYEQTC